LSFNADVLSVDQRLNLRIVAVDVRKKMETLERLFFSQADFVASVYFDTFGGII